MRNMKLWKVLARNSYVYSSHMNPASGMELYGESYSKNYFFYLSTSRVARLKNPNIWTKFQNDFDGVGRSKYYD